MKTIFKRLVSLLLIAALVLGVVPTASATVTGADPPEADILAATAAGQGGIPDEMWDNSILRALEYTKYNVQRQKDKGVLYTYEHTGSRLPSNDSYVLSKIGYGGGSTGLETVADSSTVTGRAPNISYFEQSGLVCASFLAYYYLNYLPNIEGVDTDFIRDAIEAADGNTKGTGTWKRALDALAAEDAGKENARVTVYENSKDAWANLAPGDMILFNNNDHVAVYAGEYDMYYANTTTSLGKFHFIIHVGNWRGPEISNCEWMEKDGQSLYPVRYYHMELENPKGYIEVNKKDPDGKSLAGASFLAVNQETKEEVPIGPTDSNGYAISKLLDLGTYVVTETVFPTGYQSSGTSQWTVTLTKETPNMTVTIDAVNERIPGKVQIIKKTNTDEDLDGWVIELFTKGSGNKHIQVEGSPFTTGADGTITTGDLPPGTYFASELGRMIDGELVNNPEGWIIDNTERMVTVTSGQTATVSFTNIYGNVIEIIKQTNTGEDLDGWLIGVYTDAYCMSNINGSPFVTRADGTITTGNLRDNTYYVKELGRIVDGMLYTEWDLYENGYLWELDNEVKTVTLKAGQRTQVFFRNNHYGILEIVKRTNNGTNLDGWAIGLYYDAACESPVEGSPFVTAANGRISAQLTPGTYYAKEIGRMVSGQLVTDLEGWVMDAAVKETNVIGDGTTTVTFANTYSTDGNVRVIKTTDSGGDLAGWWIGLFVDPECTEAYDDDITGEDGSLTLWDIPAGTYYAKEMGRRINGSIVTDPDGWIMDKSIKTVTVKAGQTAEVSFYNACLGNVMIIKDTNTDENLEGWSIGIYEDADCTRSILGSPFTTDEDGIAYVGNIPCGVYYAKELGRMVNGELVTDPEYWEMDTSVKTVTVVAGQTATVVFSNTHNSKIRVIKSTNTGSNLDGWVIGIYTDSDCRNPISGSPFVTAADGTITTGNLLPGTYYAKELGRMVDGQLVTEFEYWELATGVSTIYVSAGKTASVYFSNSHYGKMQIIKATNTGENLDGWMIGIYTDAECKNPVSEEPFVTDKDGMIDVVNLLPGTYYAQELGRMVNGAVVPADEYWELDPEVKAVKIVAGETATVTFTNTHYGRVQIIKTMDTDGPLEGWVFQITGQDGKVYGPYTSQQDGTITTGNLLPGIYTVKELIPEGSLYYCKSENPVTVEVKAGEIAKVSFTNALRPARITIVKKNPGGELLSGAKFLLEYSEDGVNWKEVFHSEETDPVIGGTSSEVEGGCLVTGGDGLAAFVMLHPGLKYRLTEVKAPEGYELPSGYAFEGEISGGDLEVTLTITNIKKTESGKIIVTKKDSGGKLLAGAKFLLEYSGDKGKTWKPVFYSDAEDVVLGGTSTQVTNGCLVTGSDGLAVFEHLYPGILYRLTELEAPEGYQLLTDYAFVGELPVDELLVTLAVVNSPVFTMPQSGMNELVFVSIGLTLCLLAGNSILLCLRRKRK